MKWIIDEISLHHLKIPMRESFKISSGEVYVKDSVIVEIKFRCEDDVVFGYGETSPMAGSFYSVETPESVWYELVNSLKSIKREFDKFESEIERLNSELFNFGLSSYARAGIETAFWDVFAKIKGEPIYKLLGAEYKEINSGLAVGIYDDVDELLKVIGKHLDDGGYKRVKLKIKKGWDLKPISEVRKAFRDIDLMVDANCAYSRDDIEYLRRLDEFGLLMIEQPLMKDDIEGHAILQSKISTPICLDESANSIENVNHAIEIGACEVINIKIQRMGGFLNSKKLHDLCLDKGVPVWIGTMPELGLGSVHSLHLCMLGGCKFPTDVEASVRWYVDDIVDPLIDVKDGVVVLPKDFNFSLNIEKVNKYSVNKFKIKF